MAELVVGVPREIKEEEHRVAITPDGVREVVHRGASVLVESGAGVDSAIDDEEYRSAGAEVIPEPAEIWERASIICKVKEPQPPEIALLRPGLVLFTYLHLAAEPEVASALLREQVIGIAYETVQLPSGGLPLLAPMSEVAGRMSVQVGARFLEKHRGGRGVLLGGAPGVQPAHIVVLGAGNVGWNATWIAAGNEAEVTLLDRDLDRLRWVDQIHRGRVTTMASNKGTVERSVIDADLLIGAVLVPGGRAPVLVSEDLVRAMKPGSVIVDVSVDQGGCVATIHETSHADPTYEMHGVLHYGVGNMPGAVPRTSTYALTNATLPYLAELAATGVEAALGADPALRRGVNTAGGYVTNAAVAEALAAEHRPVEEVLDLGGAAA